MSVWYLSAKWLLTNVCFRNVFGQMAVSQTTASLRLVSEISVNVFCRWNESRSNSFRRKDVEPRINSSIKLGRFATVQFFSRLPKRLRVGEIVTWNRRMRIQHQAGRGTDLQSQPQGADARFLHPRQQVRISGVNVTKLFTPVIYQCTK